MEAKKQQEKHKGDKLFKIIKETRLLKNVKDQSLKDQLKNQAEMKAGKNLAKKSDLAIRQDTGKLDYQYLKKCFPRTKSESFINEQLDTHRINENYRNRLLELELKTNGNCLFQLYDYFDNFKDKFNKTK